MPEVSEQILAYLDGALPAEDASIFSSHIASCPWCQQDVETMRALTTRISGAYRQQRVEPLGALCPPSADLTGFVEGALPQERRTLVERHVDICPNCSDAVDVLREFEAAAPAGLADAPPMPAALKEAFAAMGGSPKVTSLQAKRAASSWLPAQRWLAAVASFAVMIGVTFLLLKSPEELAPPPAPTVSAPVASASPDETLDDLAQRGVVAPRPEVAATPSTVGGAPKPTPAATRKATLSKVAVRPPGAASPVAQTAPAARPNVAVKPPAGPVGAVPAAKIPKPVSPPVNKDKLPAFGGGKPVEAYRPPEVNRPAADAAPPPSGPAPDLATSTTESDREQTRMREEERARLAAEAKKEALEGRRASIVKRDVPRRPAVAQTSASPTPRPDPKATPVRIPSEPTVGGQGGIAGPSQRNAPASAPSQPVTVTDETGVAAQTKAAAPQTPVTNAMPAPSRDADVSRSDDALGDARAFKATLDARARQAVASVLPSGSFKLSMFVQPADASDAGSVSRIRVEVRFTEPVEARLQQMVRTALVRSVPLNEGRDQIIFYSP